MKKTGKGLFIVGSLICSTFFVACSLSDNKEGKNNQIPHDETLLEQVLESNINDDLYKQANAFASSIIPSNIELQAEYVFGCELSVPQRTAKINGNDVDLIAQVVFPDGTAVQKNVVTLSQSGVYEIRYATVSNGTPYLITERFLVKNRTYYTSDASSNIYYGANAYSQIGGLNVSLAKGDVLNFEQIIDISELSKDVPLIEVYATPQTAGTWDFSQLYLTFTDIVDSSISLTIKLQRSKVSPYFFRTYILAGGNGQALTGWEFTDTHDKLHVDNQYGTLSRHSFTGASTLSGWSVENDPARIFLDKNEWILYSEADVIADLDNEEFFENLWNGFSSDKVRLSIRADEYTEVGTASFCVANVYGLNLSEKSFLDNNAPIITLERDSLPTAMVGGTYTISNATAFDDIDGKTSVSVSAWYNYGSQNAMRLNVSNGRFATDLAGVYAIVYESVDKAGNYGRFVENVITGTVAPVSVVVNDGVLTGEIGIGQEFLPPNFEVVGGSGQPEVQIIAKFDGKSYVIDESFYPEQVGEWEIHYIVTDAVGQIATSVYALNVTESDTAVFAKEPILPIAFISGSEYSIPSVTVFDYSSGIKEEKLASVTVEDANGKATYQAGATFIPKVNAHGDLIKLTFTYGNESVVREVPTALVWVQEGRPKLYMQNYFLGSGFTLTKNAGDITVRAETANASWSFANKLLAENFAVKLEADVTSNAYAGLRVRLYDSVDKNELLEFSLLKHERRSNIEIAGNVYALPMGFNDNSVSNTFEIKYLNNCLSIGKTTLNITEILDGFNGFSSKYVYLEISFIDAIVGARYKILHINDTVMCNLESDKSGPKISVYGELGGCYRLNGVIKIPQAGAGDVFDPNVVLTMSVTDANGKIVKDVNGIELCSVTPNQEYVVSLQEYGAYTITYVAKDTFNRINNETTLSFSVHVEDCEAPTIEFEGDFPETAKIGDVIKMPIYKVSDNCTSGDMLIVAKYVVQPNGHTVLLGGDKNAIKCEIAGVYEFRIYVTDEKGNSTLIRKYVTVS